MDMAIEPEGISAEEEAEGIVVNGRFRPDLDSYLQPIPGDDPAGVSVRYENIYDQIKEARRADDPSLPQGVWETELKRADWKQVETLCSTVLREQSKDIQVAAWMAEAWLHRFGYAGFAAGLDLMHRLSEIFWEGLYPRIEEDDYDFRMGPYAWINDRLSVQAKLLPVTAPSTSDARAYCMNDKDWGDRLENLSKKHEKEASRAEQGGAVTREKFLTSVALTPGSFYADLWKQSSRAYEVVEELDDFLDDTAGNAAPGLGRLRDALKDVMLFAQRTMADKGERPTFDDEEEEVTAGEAAGWPADQEDDMAIGDGPISSRAQAYRMLDAAADYLLQTEPHSPTPYLVKRAVTWGRMPLQDLLSELLQEGTDRGQLYQLLGMKMPRGDDY